MMTPKEVVLAFWEAMSGNDFHAASKWLAEAFECHWPQSGEVIAGRENFAKLNTHYPAKGKWRFHLNTIVCEDDRVVTDVSVTDGHVKARAITFHTVTGDRISKQVEYWPDPYPPPQWRRQWVRLVDEKPD